MSSSADSASLSLVARTTDNRPASLTCGSPSDFGRAAQRERQHLARARNLRRRRRRVERIVRKHLVGDDRPASLAADRRERVGFTAVTYEPVGLFGDTSSTARTSSLAAAIDSKSISHRP